MHIYDVSILTLSCCVLWMKGLLKAGAGLLTWRVRCGSSLLCSNWSTTYVYMFHIGLDIFSWKIVVWICSDHVIWSRLRSRGASTLVWSLVHIKPAVKLLFFIEWRLQHGSGGDCGPATSETPTPSTAASEMRSAVSDPTVHEQRFNHNICKDKTV